MGANNRQAVCGASGSLGVRAVAAICLTVSLQAVLQDGVHGDAWGVAFAEGELSQ